MWSKSRSCFLFVKIFRMKSVSSSLCVISLVLNPSKFADKSNVVSSAVKNTERCIVFFALLIPEFWLNFNSKRPLGLISDYYSLLPKAKRYLRLKILLMKKLVLQLFSHGFCTLPNQIQNSCSPTLSFAPFLMGPQKPLHFWYLQFLLVHAKSQWLVRH